MTFARPTRRGFAGKGASIALLCGGLLAASGMLTVQAQPPETSRSITVPDYLSTAPQRHQSSITVEASPGDVYAYISDSANWVEWFPPYQSVEMTPDGTRRTFTFGDGETTLSEDLVVRRNPTAFAWSFTPGNPLGVTDHIGLITLSGETDMTTVTLTTHYRHPDPAAVAEQFEGGGQLILGKIADRFK
ncbi:MAG: SRPBCC family protein [Pseudomonadota bacterium]